VGPDSRQVPAADRQANERGYADRPQPDARAPLAPRDMRLLLVKAREAKEYLSFHSETRITAKLSTGDVVDVTLDTEAFCGTMIFCVPPS